MKCKNYKKEVRETLEELEKMEAEEIDKSIQRKIKFLKFLKSGEGTTIERAAWMANLSRSTGTRIMQIYRACGIYGIIKSVRIADLRMMFLQNPITMRS